MNVVPADMRGILEGLVDRLDPGLPGDSLGGVFDRLIWLLDDNGEDLCEVLRDWLRTGNHRQAEAALSMREVSLFRSADEMEADLAILRARWPDLSDRADDIAERYLAVTTAQDTESRSRGRAHWNPFRPRRPVRRRPRA